MLIKASEIITQSLELYQKNYKVIGRYLLLLFIPTALLTLVELFFGSTTGVFLIFGLSAPLFVYFAFIIIASLVTMWLTIALSRNIYSEYSTNQSLSIKPELQKSLHLVLPAILVSILTFLIITGGMILLIIPGIIFAVWLAFSFYAVILDEHKATESLTLSKNLVKGRWWPVLWRLFAPAAVFGVFLLLVQWLVAIPVEMIVNNVTEGSLAFNIWLTFFSLVGVALALAFTPLTSAATIILYQELKKTPIQQPEPISETLNEN